MEDAKSGGRVAGLAKDPVTRSTHTSEVFHPDLRLDSADLLADESERFPVLFELRQSNRITTTQVEWKPAMRRAPLPGPRLPPEIVVSDTSSVLVNSSHRFTYRFARVVGSVKNPGSTIVRKARLWVCVTARAA